MHTNWNSQGARLVRASRSARSVIQASEGESRLAERREHGRERDARLLPCWDARAHGPPVARVVVGGRRGPARHGPAKPRLRGLDPVPTRSAACAPGTRGRQVRHLAPTDRRALPPGRRMEWSWSWSGWDGRVALACSAGGGAFAIVGYGGGS